MRQVNKEHSYIMSSTHQSGKVKRMKKKEITGKKKHRFIMLEISHSSRGA